MNYGKPIDYEAARTERNFAMSREILRRENITTEQMIAALDVLSASTDWRDVMLVREMRIGMFAMDGAELETPWAKINDDPAKFIPNFDVGAMTVTVLIGSGVFVAGLMVGMLIVRMGLI